MVQPWAWRSRDGNPGSSGASCSARSTAKRGSPNSSADSVACNSTFRGPNAVWRRSASSSKPRAISRARPRYSSAAARSQERAAAIAVRKFSAPIRRVPCLVATCGARRPIESSAYPRAWSKSPVCRCSPMTSQSADAVTTGSSRRAAADVSRKIARAARSWWPSKEAVTLATCAARAMSRSAASRVSSSPIPL